MRILPSSVSRTFQRVRRYVTAWKWLIGYNARSHIWLFAGAMIFGLFYRLGSLIGFIASIRCAVWIISPDRIPGTISKFLPNDPNLMLVPLVLIPGFLFVGIAVAQVVQSSIGLKLRNKVAEDLTKQYADNLLAEKTEEEVRDRPNMSAMAADIRTAHGKIITTEAMLLNLLVTALGFLLALAIGLMIEWFLMLTIAAIGVVFAAATSIFRHLKSYELSKDQEQERLNEQSRLEELVNLSRTTPKDRSVTKGIDEALPWVLQSMSSQKSVDHKFNNQSTLIIDIGQAVIVMVFLWLLIGSSNNDPAAISMLIVLVLMFRFLFSNLQLMTHLIIKLGIYYPFLVDLKKRLNTAEKVADPHVDSSVYQNEAGNG